jgi:hypothetical protein
MSYWLGLGDAMGSSAGGEQSAMQPSVRLQWAKIPVPTGPPEEELEGDPEEDELPDDELEEDPEDDVPDDEPEPDPELPEPPPELLLLLDPPHPAAPSAIKPTAYADHVTRVIRSSLCSRAYLAHPRAVAQIPRAIASFPAAYKYRLVAQTAHPPTNGQRKTENRLMFRNTSRGRVTLLSSAIRRVGDAVDRARRTPVRFVARRR